MVDCWRGKVLVEETESHVIIFLFFLFLHLGSSSSSCSSGSWSSSCGGSSGSWHAAKLALAFLNQFLNVLASQLVDNHLDLLIIGINTNRAENLLDVSGGGFSSSEGSEQSSGNVTHV